MSDSGFGLAEAELVSLFCETSLHGMYTIIFLCALYLLIVRRRRGGLSVQAKCMLTLGTVQYTLSTVHVLLSFIQDIQAFIVSHAGVAGSQSSFNDNSTPIILAELTVEVINCVLGDLILIWRAWVVWDRSFWAVAPAFCMLLGTLGTSIAEVHQFAVAPAGDSVFDAPGIETMGISFALLTFMTNVTLTLMIVGKILWQTRRIAKTLGRSVGGGTYQSVVILVAESGAVYSLAWLIGIVIFICGGNGVYILFDMIAQLTGIIPTLIIVLVTLGLTYGDGALTQDLDSSMVPRTSTRLSSHPLAARRGSRHMDSGASSGDYAYPMRSTIRVAKEIPSEGSASALDLQEPSAFV